MAEGELSVVVSVTTASAVAEAQRLSILLMGLLFRTKMVDECRQKAWCFTEYELGFCEGNEGHVKEPLIPD